MDGCVFIAKATAIYSSGHGLYSLTALHNATQPPILNHPSEYANIRPEAACKPVHVPVQVDYVIPGSGGASLLWKGKPRTGMESGSTCRHRRNHGSKSGGTNLRGPKGRSSKPEGLRAGVGFLGRGQRAPPHQLVGLGERCKLPQRGSGRSPEKN